MLENLKLQTKRLTYRLKKDYLTLNNVVISTAILIGLSWTWSSIEVMQQNYELQKLVNDKKYQLVIEKLRVENLELESGYYNTLEYQELAVRERLGKAMPGEHLLIVPSTDEPEKTATVKKEQPVISNLQEWTNFLFGDKPKNLPK